ncbi:hypothetical protein MHK_000781 [Candidatus Magnetomorum sp. HK-1]|nr:hypothetical protein MHK_000781 [Candidatus Magnetomorum sp. HK-1]
MMNVESYLKSDDFFLIVDETLRQHACKAVETFLEKNEPVKKKQLHAITTAIEGNGFKALQELIKNQKDKNTKKKNKLFWTFLNDYIIDKQKSDFLPLFVFLQTQPVIKDMLEDESSVSDKKEKKDIRKRNKKKIETIMNKVILIYFEHFNCHYFYKSRGL